MTVELFCDCHAMAAVVLVTKDCEWAFRDDLKCPEVPPDEQVIKL
mgnify:CR=1 FL=1